ncbi:hypothetical protein B7C42_08195 [Nocardia cerradoensis]|uniref:Uncharacterized protein n=1 Tax=Nocardia cerradoensis TaxID=85688 RepID=A0A231GSY1_9NOCA|nr:hypothetical protein [Nocardia cerradoensis]OXR39734.1 hypothetical protein B7C42_08195 [Nocardia cerradoensis]
MSWTHVLTTHEFWAGFPSGALVSGIVTPIITARAVRASDRRKFAQEDRVLDRKEARENKIRDEESLYNVAMEYVSVCNEILMNSVDIKGAFNAFRDMVFNRAGAPDPKADDKIDHASKVAEENKRIVQPYNRLRMVAPKNVIDAAVKLNAAMLAVLRATTEPLAQPVTRKAAADEMENFINVFRAEVGKEQYTASEAHEKTISFLANLKRQVNDYVEESREEMRAAGFPSTPWDDMEENPRR